MSKKLSPHSANQVISEIAGHGIMHALGTDVPSDNTAGYGTGCIFIQSDSTDVNTTLYVNIGNSTLCNFDPLKG